MCRSAYGSKDSIALIERWFKRIQRAAYLASTELAKEKGAFPVFVADKYLNGATVKELEPEILAAIARLRHSQCPADLDCAYGNHLAAGRECVIRH
jgi:ribonucleoside-diphosphate reductase alpha chain